MQKGVLLDHSRQFAGTLLLVGFSGVCGVQRELHDFGSVELTLEFSIGELVGSHRLAQHIQTFADHKSAIHSESTLHARALDVGLQTSQLLLSLAQLSAEFLGLLGFLCLLGFSEFVFQSAYAASDNSHRLVVSLDVFEFGCFNVLEGLACNEVVDQTGLEVEAVQGERHGFARVLEDHGGDTLVGDRFE